MYLTFSDYMTSKRLAKYAVLYYEVSSKYKGDYLSASEFGKIGGKIGAAELVDGGLKQFCIGSLIKHWKPPSLITCCNFKSKELINHSSTIALRSGNSLTGNLLLYRINCWYCTCS